MPDWFVEVGTAGEEEFEPLRSFTFDVHPYKEDPSYRAFHVNLTELDEHRRGGPLKLRLTAPSGTRLVAYHGINSETFTPESVRREDANPDAVWDAQLDLTSHLPEGTHLFRPYTTTLVEIRLNREPMPPEGPADIAKFVAIAE